MPQLNSAWFASQLFWLAITFTALYFVLSRMLLPPILEVMARRKQAAQSDIEQAQSLKSQAEQARQEYERLLADARRQAQGLFDEALAKQKAAAEQAGKALDEEIARKLSDASSRIDARRQELMDALKPSAAELAQMIVEKLTQRAPGSEQVRGVLEGLRKTGSGR